MLTSSFIAALIKDSVILSDVVESSPGRSKDKELRKK